MQKFLSINTFGTEQNLSLCYIFDEACNSFRGVLKHIVVSVLVSVADFVRSRWCLLNFVCSKNKQHPTVHCGGVKEERPDA